MKIATIAKDVKEPVVIRDKVADDFLREVLSQNKAILEFNIKLFESLTNPLLYLSETSEED